MMSKKDVLTLGMLAVGGVAVASAVADSGDGNGGGGAALEGKKGRAGGILGSQEGYGGSPTVYNFPAQGAVSFPTPPDYSNVLTGFLGTQAPVSRGAAGVSSAGKKHPSGAGWKSAPAVPGYVPMSVSKETGWLYSTHEKAVSEAVSAGLPEHIARQELSVYRSSSVPTSKKVSTQGRASSKAVQKARATARHTAARKKRMESK